MLLSFQSEVHSLTWQLGPSKLTLYELCEYLMLLSLLIDPSSCSTKCSIPMLFKQFDMFQQFDFKYFIAEHLTQVGTPQNVPLILLMPATMLSLRSQLLDLTSASAPFIGQHILFSPANSGNSWLFSHERTSIKLPCSAPTL
jgi:hypothetical protein